LYFPSLGAARGMLPQFGMSQYNSLNHGCVAGAQAILDGRSWSQKISGGGIGARNLG